MSLIHLRRSSFAALLLHALVALLALVVVGCDGSDDGGGGGGPTTPEPFVVLIPDADDPPSVSMARSDATEGANLLLEIHANELENVRTIDFVLSYPGTLLRPVSVQAGEFLGLGASVLTTALDQNRLQVLMTRLPADGASGDGLVLSVQFEALAPGTGRIQFVDPEASTPTGLPIADIAWLGGGVEVSP